MSAEKDHLLGDLAALVEGDLRGDKKYPIRGLNTLQAARSDQLTFLANPAYQKYLDSTQAGAVILSPDLDDKFSGNRILVKNPYLAYAKLTEVFQPAGLVPMGTDATAYVADNARIGKEVAIGPNAVIQPGAEIGDGAIIGPGSVVGRDSVIGEGSRLYANVTVYHGVAIGCRVTLHSGCVIGADGFGFAPGAGRWVKIHQLGGVIIGDDVEIGACTTVDRGALDDTLVGNGVIIDNQVQIAHNVKIGDYTAIAGCAGIAGSTTVGKHCLIGGAACIAGHLTIADHVQISGTTFVNRSIDEPGSYSSGILAAPSATWRKNAIRFGQLDKIYSRLTTLEKKLVSPDNKKS